MQGAPFLQIAVQNAVELREELLLQLFHHIENIIIMQVEGAPVDVRQVRQLLHGDILDILFLHQANQPLQEKSPGSAYPAVCFVRCHGNSPYL